MAGYHKRQSTTADTKTPPEPMAQPTAAKQSSPLLATELVTGSSKQRLFLQPTSAWFDTDGPATPD